ncbi:MAG: hypothetical protein EPN84_10050 [Legionella sp.]|nr:MAG: hypothetical protein EPN84_10050 [Legionella sp.]
MQIKIRMFFLLFFFSSMLWAAPTWYTQNTKKNTVLNVELFLSSTCEHCHKADAFFHKLEASNSWLKVKRHIINEDKSALDQFYQLLNEQNMGDFAVPSAFFCDSRWVGFVNEATTGKDLLKGLQYCKKQIEKNGTLDKTTIDVLKHWANANLFDTSMDQQPKVSSYIVMMAIIDALNPCALFCLMGLIALLLIQNETRTRYINGFLFIAALGMVHYLQQVYPTVFFESLIQLRWLVALIGLLTLFFAVRIYQNKPIKYLSGFLAILLGLSLQAYQQTCLMNWSFITQQWLSNQKLTALEWVLAQSAYQLLYLLPWVFLILIIQWLLKKQKLVQLQPLLKIIGLVYLIGLGLLLIIYPAALAYLNLSLLLLISFAIIGVILYKLKI